MLDGTTFQLKTCREKRFLKKKKKKVAGIMGNGLSGYVNHKNNYKSYTFTLPPSFLLSLMCICFWTVVIFHLYVL